MTVALDLEPERLGVDKQPVHVEQDRAQRGRAPRGAAGVTR